MNDPTQSPPLVAAARGIAPLAAAHAVKAELDRRLGDETADAIRDAGFARHFVPARWGGAEGGFEEFADAVAALGEGDQSAAWCASIASTLGRMAAFLPEAGQRAVWEHGPDAMVVGALMPGGTAVPRPGGWEVSGSWSYLSGIHASEHALLCCPVQLPDGGSEVRFLLVPRAAYGVRQTWFTAGMRGTGSDTLVLEPCFVPLEHTFLRDELVAGRAEGPACHRAPLRGVSGLGFAAPMLGGASGMLELFAAATASKRAAPGNANRMAAGTGIASDLEFARASAETDAARLLLRRAARDADLGRSAGPLPTARAHRDYAVAADLLTSAVNRVVRVAGTGAQAESSPLQRHWRDANAAAGHVALQWEPAGTGYAAAVHAGLAPAEEGR